MSAYTAGYDFRFTQHYMRELVRLLVVQGPEGCVWIAKRGADGSLQKTHSDAESRERGEQIRGDPMELLVAATRLCLANKGFCVIQQGGCIAITRTSSAIGLISSDILRAHARWGYLLAQGQTPDAVLEGTLREMLNVF